MSETNSPDGPNPIFPDLKDQIVFITGGGSGIGAEFTRAFAAQGARIGFVSLRRRTANRLCEEIEVAGQHRPLFIPCDVRDIDALRQAMAEIRSDLGPITVLINNAARDTRHQLASTTVDEWDNAINTNLRPYFFTVQAAQKDMACLLYTSPSPRDGLLSRMPSSA